MRSSACFAPQWRVTVYEGRRPAAPSLVSTVQACISLLASLPWQVYTGLPALHIFFPWGVRPCLDEGRSAFVPMGGPGTVAFLGGLKSIADEIIGPRPK